jgi:hypothetical protein
MEVALYRTTLASRVVGCDTVQATGLVCSDLRAASPLRDSSGFSPDSLNAVRPGEPGNRNLAARA